MCRRSGALPFDPSLVVVFSLPSVCGEVAFTRTGAAHSLTPMCNQHFYLRHDRQHGRPSWDDVKLSRHS